MKTLLAGMIILSLAGASIAQAQHAGPGDDHMRAEPHPGWAPDQGGSHKWRQGERMGYNDWSAAKPVDYRQHHLNAPPPGYEWRESNGQFVLGAVATGVIASIILSAGH